MWPDHDVVVVLGFDEVVDRVVECASDRGELVEADPAVAGLDPAQWRGAEVAAPSQVVQRPAARNPQTADALSDQPIDVAALRHTQEHMSSAQRAPRIPYMSPHCAHHHVSSGQRTPPHAHDDAHDGLPALLDLDAE